VLKAQRIMANC